MEFHSVPLALPPHPPPAPSPPPLPAAEAADSAAFQPDAVGSTAAAAAPPPLAPPGDAAEDPSASPGPADSASGAGIDNATSTRADPADQAGMAALDASPDPGPPAEPTGASAWAGAALSAAAARGRRAAGSPASLLAVGASLVVALAGSVAAIQAMRRRWQRRRVAPLYSHLQPSQSVQAGKLVSAAAFV